MDFQLKTQNLKLTINKEFIDKLARNKIAIYCLRVKLTNRIKEKQRRAHGECLWLLEARKDATSCEKLGLGAHNRLTPRYPNGTTHRLQDLYP